jgi:hypothetical protein
VKHASAELGHLDGHGGEDCVPDLLGVGAHDEQVVSGLELLVTETAVCGVL